MVQKKDHSERIFNIIARNQGSDSEVIGIDNLCRILNIGKVTAYRGLKKLIDEKRIVQSKEPHDTRHHWKALEPDFQKPINILDNFDNSLTHYLIEINKIIGKIGKKPIFKDVRIRTIYTPTLTFNRTTNETIIKKDKGTGIQYTKNKKEFELLEKFIRYINQIFDNITSVIYTQVLSDYKIHTKKVEEEIQIFITKSTSSARYCIRKLLENQPKKSGKAVENHLTFQIRGYANAMRVQNSFIDEDFIHNSGWNTRKSVRFFEEKERKKRELKEKRKNLRLGRNVK